MFGLTGVKHFPNNKKGLVLRPLFSGKLLLFRDILLNDVKAAFATFALAKGLNVGIILREAVNNATIGGIKVKNLFLTGAADFLDPLLCLALNLISALALIVGNIDVDASNLSVARNQRHHNDVLEGAEVVGVFTDEERIHASRWNRKLDYVILDGRIYGDINTEEGQKVLEVLCRKTN
jgi:hypothetical protein